MIIRPDILPDDLPDEARDAREDRVPGARWKPVPTARGRKAYSCTIFVLLASS